MFSLFFCVLNCISFLAKFVIIETSEGSLNLWIIQILPVKDFLL